ncbi:uncharacterized protein KY384_002230 [Bacidia gigantensis]|uniref:uncharacterized protein n=1 Tax=Bacidia gigantensis TaxID=2732470 RepID=UPI001D03BE98|nr:uncharacterized protein KY384_002230 [Bacidia gigantensis]KAG8533447.1 hypothetical protein KY384_002230 [Bacidia gigantensis]
MEMGPKPASCGPPLHKVHPPNAPDRLTPTRPLRFGSTHRPSTMADGAINANHANLHVNGNGPLIPERTSLTPAKIHLNSPKDKERKRKSLPASPNHNHDFRRRSSNRVTVKPASPEVISSLIETLSVISAPAEQHFDSLPNITESHSTPVSPSAWDTHFPRSGSSFRAPPSPLANGFSIDTESVAESTSPSITHLHPAHAIETPSRRSSKHATEISIKQKSRGAAYEESLDDAYSIGTLSIERGVTPAPSLKLPDKKKSLRSLRSARSIRSLAMRNSTDSLPKGDVPVFVAKKEPEKKRERLFLTGSGSSSPTPEGLSVKKRDSRIDAPVDAFDLLHSTDEAGTLPSVLANKRLYWDSEDAASSAGPSQSKRSSYNFAHQGQIPTRSSSKRQSLSYASRHRRSKTTQSDRSVGQDDETEAGDDSFVTPPQTPTVAIAELDEASVNRRIEELREQKAQRDRLEAEAAAASLDIPEEKSRSRSHSPLPREPTPDQTTAGKTELKLPNGHVENTPTIAENEETAPSPSVRVVPLRTDKNTETKITPKIHPSPLQDNQRSFSAPQRANSKLFRRQPRPGTPTSTEKHRRRLSLQIGGPKDTSNNNSPRPDSADSIDIAIDEYLSSPRLSQQVANPVTGRVISFSEVGDPNGSVIFCCVGMGLTRYVSAFYDDIAKALKLRLITPDRPGVGGSEPYADENNTPLNWPDDVRTICEHRGITKFSILAHSAGAIYALATALRMPQHIRCRVHLLAPWIPPSQMSAIGTAQEPLPSTAIPYSQRFLRSLPEAWFRAANSNFFSVTSNKLTTSLPRSSARKKRNANKTTSSDNAANGTPTPKPKEDHSNEKSPLSPLPPPFSDKDKENRPPTPSPPSLPRSSHARSSSRASSPLKPTTTTTSLLHPSNTTNSAPSNPTDPTRSADYETRLATRIWDLSQAHSNPHLDLLTCLERRHPIGFRYVDITRPIVIHHGSKDTRVPVENVKWLGGMMNMRKGVNTGVGGKGGGGAGGGGGGGRMYGGGKCEVRILEGEGHGLMANAAVMADVLGEVAGEWRDWEALTGGGRR